MIIWKMSVWEVGTIHNIHNRKHNIKIDEKI